MMRADAHVRRVVVDTNVWLSAALSADGAPAQLVRMVLTSGVPVFSQDTFAEVETRLWRPKFDPYLSIELRRRILRDLSAAAFWVDVPAHIAKQTFCRDAHDDKFIHAALSAQARWLITGDKDLLDAPSPPHMRILSPAQALRRADFLLK